MSSALPAAIAMLSSSDSSERAAGAREIYRVGRQSADEASRDWRNDTEFAALLESAAGANSPQVTVGLAVNPNTFEVIRDANGSPDLAEVPPDQDAREFELQFDDATVALDILTTRDPSGQGAIARYLSKFGEGIQQVEYRCSNVDAATALLKKKFAVEPINPQTRAGADGTRINFFLARTSDGSKVLIELYEK
jgi:methylmalonyl-CoA/ethylmalonyl-CoA epimerase